MSNKRLYQTSSTSLLPGVKYYLDESLAMRMSYQTPSVLNHSPAWMNQNGNMVLLEVFENFVSASEFYSHALAHLGMFIAVVGGYTAWWKIVLGLIIGFITGKILSCVPHFIAHNAIGNIFMGFVYNKIQVYFIIDIALFVCYIFLIKTWWMIPIHIAAFFLAQNVFGLVFSKARDNALEKLALRAMYNW